MDGYDDLMSGIELSHRQGLGFSIIKSYHGNPEKLDFRFARVQDNIEVKQKENIKDVYLNSVNIRYTFIDGSDKCNYDITINSDIIDFAISLKWFIRNNKDTIESINFQGVENRLMAMLIGKICAEGGINKISFVDEESVDIEKETEDNNEYTNKML